MKYPKITAALCMCLIMILCTSSVFARKKKTSDSVPPENEVQTEVRSSEEKTGGRKPAAASDSSFSGRTVENQVGQIKLLLKGGIGSFQLYSVSTDGIAYPVLAGYDEFTSSFFSILIGSKEYRLSDRIGISVGAQKTEKGGQLVYVISDTARVLVDFTCLSSDSKRDADILKITVSVTNRGKRTAVFAVKNVLDTILGEQTDFHFATAQDVALNHEMQYRKMNKAKWIYSGNSKASMQILLYGGDITVPEVVSLGNKDMLALPVWTPAAGQSKTFNSVLSYNNSAVGINWEGVSLAPDGEYSVVYYIAFGVGLEKPQGELFLKNLDGKSADKNKSSAINPAENIEIIENGRAPSAAPGAADLNNLPVPLETEREIPNVNFDVESIGREKLNPEYIQNLINRINTLEQDYENVDRAELLRLNSELDAILEILRQK